MKRLFNILVMVGAAMIACAQVPESVSKMADKLNEACPTEISDGMTLVKVEIDDGSFIFDNKISDQLFDSVSGLAGILHDSLLAEMMSSPDGEIQALLKLCKEQNYKIINRFINSEGKTFDVIILPAEL